jgi:cyclic beta-1,2-glucan synthetase
MQRYRGHFFNWYDTRTLAPLAPAYISTVDSGNLAGYLLTLRSGLTQAVETAPIVDARLLNALEDALELCAAEIDRATRGRPGRALRKEIANLRAKLAERPDPLTPLDGWRRLLPQLTDGLSAVSVLLHELEESLPAAARGEEPPGSISESMAEATYWLDRAAAAILARHEDLDRLAGWLEFPNEVAAVKPASVPSLTGLVAWCDRVLDRPDWEPSAALRESIEAARRHAIDLIERAERLGVLADDLIEETEFGFLFNRERQLFSIGFSVSDGLLDNSYYDILASEARLASFMAIATGAISHDHWFKLGRALTPSGSSRALLSWSASS